MHASVATEIRSAMVWRIEVSGQKACRAHKLCAVAKLDDRFRPMKAGVDHWCLRRVKLAVQGSHVPQRGPLRFIWPEPSRPPRQTAWEMLLATALTACAVAAISTPIWQVIRAAREAAVPLPSPSEPREVLVFVAPVRPAAAPAPRPSQTLIRLPRVAPRVSAPTTSADVPSGCANR